MAETTERPTLPQYYPSLDGLRGAGVIAMLLYHTNLGLASGAFLAISMFFTLSGYLIGGQLHAEFARSGRIDLVGFWERRIRRLMPAASLGLAGASAYAVLLARPDQISRFAGDILAALFYVPNWRFVVTGQSYDAIFSDPSPVQHFWSLGVEEQFYLGLPLLLWAVLARGSTRSLALVTGIIALASAAAMSVLRVPGTPLGHAYYGTDARVAEVLVGVLLALWLRSGPRLTSERARAIVNALAMAILSVSFVLWWTTSEGQLWFYRGGALAYAMGTAITIVACLQPGPLQRLLSFAPLIYFGRISYGLYVYHWPIYLALDAVDPGLPPAAMLAAKIATTVAVSAVSHRLVELPIRKRERFAGPRRWLVPPAAIALLACAAMALRLAFPAPGSTLEARLDLEPRPAATPSARQNAAAEPLAARDLPPRIIVAGDSMAENIGRGLAAWGADSGAAEFAYHSIPACGIALEGERRLGKSPADMSRHMCRTMQAHWRGQQYLAPYDVIVLVIGTMDIVDRRIDGWSDYRSPGDPVFDDWLVDVYASAVDVLVEAGVKVVWLTYACSGPEQYLRDHRSMDNIIPLIAAAAFDTQRIQHLNEQLLPRVRDARPDDVSLVDLFSHVCPGGEFVPSLGSVAQAREDGVHFSEAGGRALADWLGPRILDAIAAP